MATRTTSRARMLSACLFGGALIAAAAVQAQSFVGIGPVRSFVLPTEPRGEPQPSPASIGVPDSAPPKAEPPLRDGLRRLPATQAGLRFEGEWSQSEWPVYLTRAQTRRAARFTLSFLSAISVMPEGSQLTLTVNDAVIARTMLSPPDRAGEQSFAIPAGLLKPGYNAIRITAEQRHRVDCSPAATYELSTALDAARTGLVFEGEGLTGGFESSADIAAVAPRQDGASAIRILTAGTLTPEMAGRAIKAAQIAALAGRWQQPLVAFAGEGNQESGLELAVGTIEALRGRLDMAGFGVVAGPRFGFLPGRPERAPTFVVTGMTPADLDTALAQWNAERQSAAVEGSPAGLRALSNQPGLAASGAFERIALGRTGFTDTAFSGRLFRFGLDVAMPTDFMPADYDRMTLTLAGSHGADLTSEARITVQVNGADAGTQMLAKGGANALDRNQIFLPLRLMRPGANRIAIAAQVPVAADDACAAGSTRRLQILDRSELVLPRVARIGRAPELSLLAAGGYPFSRSDARPILYVPTPDRQTMAAAATLATRLAVAAGRTIDFSFAMTPPSLDAGEVLMVAPAPALDPALLRVAGLDPERLKAAWQGLVTPRMSGDAADFDASTRLCALPQRPASKAAPAAHASGQEAPSLFTALGLRAGLPALPFWQSADPAGSRSESEVVSASAVLLVGQDFPSPEAQNLWTVFTAPDAASLKAGIDCLVHPAMWSRLGGRISGLGEDEAVSTVPAGERQRLVATQGFSLPNLRLVAAGWLSLNPAAYVGLALMLVLLLAASTLWLVLNTGRRQE